MSSALTGRFLSDSNTCRLHENFVVGYKQINVNINSNTTRDVHPVSERF